ncbi:tyrosine-type recombinase/integrase [Chitinilyticum litopenaei]|uniref:tyrosine-type recombinase/integrase n=1 Tax=Chitinilyticum litopenaei TaxID=1121276 RepID=UPI001B7FD986|nr:tyrosine-type recombinase/integrase [Chitinilyticum litopenaei]
MSKKPIKTDLQAKNAKPEAKDYQLAAGGGLFLVVRSTGGKSWVLDFVCNGERHRQRLGKYPAVSLAEACRLRDAARKVASQGGNPAELLTHDDSRTALLDGKSVSEASKIKAEQEAFVIDAARMTFAEAAGRYKAGWVNQKWKNPDKAYATVRLHLLPQLGALALDDITAPDLRELLYAIRERRGEQAALHAHGWASRIFAYAVEHDWCNVNPAQAIKAARIGQKGKRGRYLSLQEMRRYLACLYQTDGYRGYKLALHLLLMLALRKNELCGAHWSEFDLVAAEWLIPAFRMKTKKEHRVFLPVQAVAILEELRRLGGGSEWVMPMPTNPKRPMNGNNLDGVQHAALIAAKIEDYVIHDHRHTASTQIREQGIEQNPEVIETILSHAIPGMAGVYSQAEYKTQRLAALQKWADFLDWVMNEQTVIAATFRKIA